MFKNFSIASFDIIIRAETIISLPPYAGSTLRGGLGYALKEEACFMELTECSECPANKSCLFIRFFESPTPDGASVLSKNSHIPHPFILDPPPGGILNPGECTRFTISLIGESINFFPVFYNAFQRLGMRGVGKGRGKFKVEKVEQRNLVGKSCPIDKQLIFSFQDFLDWVQSFNNINSVSMTFETPLRLKRQGNFADSPAFVDILNNLLFRISALHTFYCGDQDTQICIKDILEKGKEIVNGESTLSWSSWCRYSGRQSRSMDMGGVVGRIVFHGSMEPFILSLLKLGEKIHVGKGTSLGLGKYLLQIYQ